MDPRDGLDVVENREIYCPFHESNLSPQPVARRNTDLDILVQSKRLMLHMRP